MAWNPFTESWGLGTSDWGTEDWVSFGTLPIYKASWEAISGKVEGIGKGVEAQTRLLAEFNAQFIRDEAAEQVRRARLQHEDLRSQVIGIQSSSGFLSAGGTAKAYVARMDEAFQAEIEYIDKATESRVDIALLEGVIQGEMAKDAERAQQLGIVTDVIGIFS